MPHKFQTSYPVISAAIVMFLTVAVQSSGPSLDLSFIISLDCTLSTGSSVTDLEIQIFLKMQTSKSNFINCSLKLCEYENYLFYGSQIVEKFLLLWFMKLTILILH